MLDSILTKAPQRRRKGRGPARDRGLKRATWVGLFSLALTSACLTDFTVGDGDASDTSGTGTSGDGDADGDADGGSCEVNCDDAREICDGAQCLCREGLTRCGDVCVDTSSNPAHCGACQTACGADACEEGECQAGGCQEEDLTDCGGACVDTDSHPLHCNGCDRPCQANELCIEANCREFDPGDCMSDEDCSNGRKCCPLEEGESMLCIDGGECP